MTQFYKVDEEEEVTQPSFFSYPPNSSLSNVVSVSSPIPSYTSSFYSPTESTVSSTVATTVSSHHSNRFSESLASMYTPNQQSVSQTPAFVGYFKDVQQPQNHFETEDLNSLKGTKIRNEIKSFKSFLEDHKPLKSKNDQRSGKPFYRSPSNLVTFEGDLFCGDCCQKVDKCHYALFGEYCKLAVARYYDETKMETNEIVAKRVFMNAYWNQLDIWKVEQLKGQKKKKKLEPVSMPYPSVCLEKNGYMYAMNWFAWKKNGSWIKPREQDKIEEYVPDTFFQM